MEDLYDEVTEVVFIDRVVDNEFEYCTSLCTLPRRSKYIDPYTGCPYNPYKEP